MDTDRFEITLDHKEFYNSYINTIRKLYSESFIQKNNIMPDNEQSLAKTMLTTMGRAFDQYDTESFNEIIKRTNERYEKIKGSGIVGEVKEKVLRNITIFADIISNIMKEVGMYDLSEKFNCTSKKLLEENVTGNNLNEHINDSVKSTESGIDELNGILDQISEADDKSIFERSDVKLEDIRKAADRIDDNAIIKDIENDEYLAAIDEVFSPFYDCIDKVKKSLTNQLIKGISGLSKENAVLKAENINLKKQLDEAMKEAASIPTDPEKRIELIKELISSHKDKAELKEILISFIVNL